jgi:chromatin structure-remodeling complex subunit SFH1
MQPNFLAATGTGSNTPGPGTNKRSRQVVNYAEIEGLDVDSDEESNDSDARKRGSTLPRRVSNLQQPSGAEQKVQLWGDGKSYLGVLPPGNLVIVQQIKPTKHTALSVLVPRRAFFRLL